MRDTTSAMHIKPVLSTKWAIDQSKPTVDTRTANKIVISRLEEIQDSQDTKTTLEFLIYTLSNKLSIKPGKVPNQLIYLNSRYLCYPMIANVYGKLLSKV